MDGNIVKTNVNKVIQLLEEALKNISPQENTSHDMKLHIVRAINEANYVRNKKVRVAKKEQSTVRERWELDLQKQILINPKQQKFAINALDALINAEQQKLDELTNRKNNQNANISQYPDNKNVGTILG